MTLYNEIIKDEPLAYWRMSDSVSSSSLTSVNLCYNPSLELNASGYGTGRHGSSSGSTATQWAGSRRTDGGAQGSAYWRATATASWPFRAWLTTPEMPAAPSRAYTLSFYVRVNRPRSVLVAVDVLRENNSYISAFVSPYFEIPANTWFRVTQICTIPNNGAKLRPTVAVDSTQVGDTLEVDGLLYEEATTLSPYFDGNTPGAVWTGTPNASTSSFTVTTNHRYLEDENGIYRGNYSATGVTFNVPAYPEGGDGATQFATAGSATVVGGNGVWDLGSVSGQWTIEFLARFDIDTGGTLLSTDRWKIATVGSGQIGYMPADNSEGAGGVTVVPVNAPWQDNAWHHYALTQGANGLLTWYVDGQDVLAFADTNIDAAGSGALQIAGGVAVTLDDLAIYPRALNDGRISAHFMSLDDAFGEVVTSTYIEPRQTVLTLIKGANVVQQMTVTVQYSGGGTASPLNAVWSVSDPTVVSISATGLVRALKAGSAGITVTIPDLSATAFTAVSVLPAEPLPGEDRAIYSEDSEQFLYDDDGNLFATTKEYWEVDPGRLVRGEWVYDAPVSLATLAYNISTLAGREGIPVADGENIRISTRSGRRWVPKTPDQKQISLAMWAQGTNVDGTVPTDVYMRTKFWENYNKLKSLFAVWDRQILLRRRVPTRFGIQTMQTWVEPAGSMDLNPTGPMRAAFTVDLVMTDPFWRSEEQKSDPVKVKAAGGVRRYPRTYPLEYGSYGATGIYTLLNDGTHEARLVAEIHGPVTNPMFFNMDTNERFRLLTDVEIEIDDVIEVDFLSRTIDLKGSGSRYWWLDRTTDWLTARPGLQRLQFSHEGYEEAGYVVWRWEPAYL